MIEKIDNFLPSRLEPGIIFQKDASPSGALRARRATGASELGPGDVTRKWRRKPLRSLKTDSEMAIAALAMLESRVD
jgi:hypothetical protein